MTNTLAEWLADAIVQNGTSGYEVAKRSGLRPATISLILNGKSGAKRGHDRETVKALARATLPEDAD